MKKFLAGIVAVVTGTLMGMFIITTPVMAAESSCPEGSVPTAILGTDGCSDVDDGSGSSVIKILELVVEIMTVGIGILGVIGIIVSGLQYLTAGSSEEQTKKAKRRLFEIVIGLVTYVVMFALLTWLVPDFNPFG